MSDLAGGVGVVVKLWQVLWQVWWQVQNGSAMCDSCDMCAKSSGRVKASVEYAKSSAATKYPASSYVVALVAMAIEVLATRGTLQLIGKMQIDGTVHVVTTTGNCNLT